MGDEIPTDDPLIDFTMELETVPRPVDWRRLSGDDFAREMALLDEWVRWLVGRYDLDGREVPPCWHRHGSLTEELSALRGAHLIAFEQEQPASIASDWHRLLWDVRVRLRDAVSRSGCTERNHNDNQPPSWASPTEAYAEALELTIRRLAQR